MSNPFELAHLFFLVSPLCTEHFAETFITTTVYKPCYFLLTVCFRPFKFRNDEQKHRQLGKTVSRKAQKRSEGKGKGKGSKGK